MWLKTMLWFPCRHQDCLLVMALALAFSTTVPGPRLLGVTGWWVSQAVDQAQLRDTCACVCMCVHVDTKQSNNFP